MLNTKRRSRPRAMAFQAGFCLCQRYTLTARMDIRYSIFTLPSRWTKSFCMTTRPFLSDRGQRLPDSPQLRLPSHLRQIILPDTRRGRRATGQAKNLWIQVFGASAGNVQTNENPNPIEPLSLLIDDRLMRESTITCPYGIVFARSDQIGLKLWRIAHPMPWSMRSRWIKWPTYILAGLYSLLFTLWFFGRERVPITGRKQFRCYPLQGPPSRGNHFSVVSNENTAKFLLAENEPRVVRIRSVLDRVLLASWLDPLEWTLFVLDDLGEYCLPCAPWLIYASPSTFTEIVH